MEPLTIQLHAADQGQRELRRPEPRFDPNGQYEGLDTSESDTTNGDFTYQAHDGDRLSAAADVR